MANAPRSNRWYGFAHVNTYARQPKKQQGRKLRSVFEVIGELQRLEGYCNHVPSPQPPRHIAGIHPDDLAGHIDRLVEERGREKKKTRGDMHVLVAAVYSWPEPLGMCNNDLLEQWIQDILDWHKHCFGEVDCAALHVDETYPHLHIHTVTPRARHLHPGWVAKEAEAKRRAALKKAGLLPGDKLEPLSAFHKTAMSKWQDELFAAVFQKYNFERKGPQIERKPAKVARAIRELQAELALLEHALRERDATIARLSSSIRELESAKAQSDERMREAQTETDRIFAKMPSTIPMDSQSIPFTPRYKQHEKSIVPPGALESKEQRLRHIQAACERAYQIGWNAGAEDFAKRNADAMAKWQAETRRAFTAKLSALASQKEQLNTKEEKLASFASLTSIWQKLDKHGKLNARKSMRNYIRNQKQSTQQKKADQLEKIIFDLFQPHSTANIQRIVELMADDPTCVAILRTRAENSPRLETIIRMFDQKTQNPAGTMPDKANDAASDPSISIDDGTPAQ